MSDIYKRVTEQVMASFGKGVCLKLTGSIYGLSYDDWESLVRKELREKKFETPRCQRLRSWNPEVRLAQLGDI